MSHTICATDLNDISNNFVCLVEVCYYYFKGLDFVTMHTQGEMRRRCVKSSQVTFIYIVLSTIQIVSKQLHNIKIGKWCQ